MEDLKTEAEALGIDVDGRWGEARLRQEIERAKAEAANTNEEEQSDGNETDAAGEHPGEGESGTDAGGEPAGDLPVDAGADDAGSAGGGDEGEAVDDAEAGDRESEESEADLPAGDRLSGPDREHATVAQGDNVGVPAPEDQSQPPVDDIVHGMREQNERPEGEPTATVEAGGEAATPPVVKSDVVLTDPGDGSADEAAEFGGLPPDLPPLDEEGQRVAIEVARLAMTAPIIAAFNAASAMAGETSFDTSWFAREGDVCDYLPALVKIAVPFVREWPTAPVEALYSHVARAAPALRHETGWDDLHFSHRLAWEVFRDVLVKADAAIGAEARRREAAEASDRWGQSDTREDDTMFAPSTSREQRSDLGQARDRL